MMDRTNVLILLLLSLCFTSGCTHTHPVTTDTFTPATRQRLMEASHWGKARILLTNGQRINARNLVFYPPDASVYPDSITAQTKRGPVTLYPEQIARIQYRHNGPGALDGLFMGAILATAASFGVLLVGDTQDDALVGVERLIPLTGATGFLLGLFRADRETYKFIPPAPLPGPLPAVTPQPRPTEATLPPTTATDPPLSTDPPPVEAPAPDTVGAQPPVEEPVLPPSETPPVQRERPRIFDPGPPPAEETRPPVEETRPPIVLTTSVDRSGWVLVIASPTDVVEADDMRLLYAERLQGENLMMDIRPMEVRGVLRYRVTVGFFETQRAALAERRRLASLLPPDAWVLRLLAN